MSVPKRPRRARVRPPVEFRQLIYNLIVAGPGVVGATAVGIQTAGDAIATGIAGLVGLGWGLAVQTKRDSPRERAAHRKSVELLTAIERFNSPQRVMNDERIWRQQQQ